MTLRARVMAARNVASPVSRPASASAGGGAGMATAGAGLLRGPSVARPASTRTQTAWPPVVCTTRAMLEERWHQSSNWASGSASTVSNRVCGRSCQPSPNKSSAVALAPTSRPSSLTASRPSVTVPRPSGCA